MPPGRRRMQYARATLVGVLNSNASNDTEARQRVVRLYGPLLGVAFLIDICCAVTLMVVKCHEDEVGDGDGNEHGDEHGDESVWSCMRQEMKDGISLPSLYKQDSDGGGFGDLVWLSIFRCILTVLILLVGVRFGSSAKNKHGRDEDLDSERENSGGLHNGHPHSQEDTCIIVPEPLGDDGNGNGNGNDSRPVRNNGTSTATGNSLLEPLLNNDNNDGENNLTNGQEDENRSHSSTTTSTQNQSIASSLRSWFHQVKMKMSPAICKNMTLVLLFITTTFYQIYAGLKVSTYEYPHHQSSSTKPSPLLPILMCLTILWINAQSYFFRVLLDELTREEGLFLPEEVHRHPVFYQESRGIAMHWCDLCRQRIKPNSGGCYRCSLCDFDICMACAKRSDAATVGENVLRGDSGVRTEIALDNKGYFTRTLRVVKPELGLIMVSLVLLACTSITRLLLPHFQGHIIDKVIPDENGNFDRDGFSKFIKIYVYLMLVQGAMSTLYSSMFTLVSRRLKFTIRNSLFERILSQDVAYFDGTESGRLLSNLTNDLDLMMSPIQSSLSSLLNNLLILVGGMIMCFVKSYRLSMLAFVTVGPITYLWDSYAQWSKGLAREMLAYWAEGNSIASQALSHIRTVKAFGCEDNVIDKYSEANKQALDCGVKDAWGNGLTSALTGYLDLGSGVMILYFGGLLVYKGEMSVGELVTFQLFWNMMNNAYQNLQGLVTSFTRSAAGAEKIFSLWESDPDIDPKQGSEITWDVQGELELRNVKFFYQMRPDNVVLDNFNLVIPAGNTVALVGRSGGGKSTIINLLLRFYDARDGKLLIDGNEYKSLKVNHLRRLFGVVSQETELFALTVEENIAYGLEKDEYSMEDLVNAAKKAQAYEFISEMKDGFRTRIGERGNRLSGGQRQRIAIARVFLRKPKIILLDEATSALDEHSQESVQKALSLLIAECNATVVLVAHRLSTVMNADSIVVIDKGTVLEQGTHEELVANSGGVYASMVRKQQKKMANELDQDNHPKPGEKDKVASDDIDALLDENVEEN